MRQLSFLILSLIILTTGLLIISCVPQPDVSDDQIKQLAEKDIILEYPDDLDSALEEVELVNEG